ncbi:MAG: hypothetical protein QOE37_1982 [Microbacteriaceae bacterium]|nr:hypothetical protein [Microbacteriaceae bacterium]
MALADLPRMRVIPPELRAVGASRWMAACRLSSNARYPARIPCGWGKWAAPPLAHVRGATGYPSVPATPRRRDCEESG